MKKTMIGVIGAIFFLLITLLSLPFFRKKRNKQIVNFWIIILLILFLVSALLAPTVFSSPKAPSVYYQKIQNTPLFPGVDTLGLGRLANFGEVLGVCQHTMNHAYFYLYRLKGEKLKKIGTRYLLPPKTEPVFAFIKGRLWICLGQDEIADLAYENHEWKRIRAFKTGNLVMGIANFHGKIVLALAEKPGWSTLFLYSTSGRKLWEEKRRWNARAYSFGAAGNNLWVSVNHWDGLTARILHFHFIPDQNEFHLICQQQTSTFKTGKIILDGAGILRHQAYVAATVWGFTPFGLLAKQVLYNANARILNKILMVFPFHSSFLSAVLTTSRTLEFAEEFHPTREIVLPDSIAVWGIKQIPHSSTPLSLGFDPEGLKNFMNQPLPKPAGTPKTAFNPLPYRSKLLPWQWKSWKRLMKTTGQDGIAGISGHDYPLAHGWDAISDPNPRHTVWANAATPRDYLTGKVKGTVWPYIPFDTHPRVILCERCHPLRRGIYPFWCMYNVMIKGNKLTPDGMRVPPR